MLHPPAATWSQGHAPRRQLPAAGPWSGQEHFRWSPSGQVAAGARRRRGHRAGKQSSDNSRATISGWSTLPRVTPPILHPPASILQPPDQPRPPGIQCQTRYCADSSIAGTDGTITKSESVLHVRSFILCSTSFNTLLVSVCLCLTLLVIILVDVFDCLTFCALLGFTGSYWALYVVSLHLHTD